MSESIEYQRGEPFRLIRVFRESSDGGTTWTRLPLTGRHYARDIRSRNSEAATLLLSIRDDDADAYARLEGESVQLDDEDTASAVGVVVVEVPADVATAALTVGSLPTDEAIIEANGDPVYMVKGAVAVRSRITVLT